MPEKLLRASVEHSLDDRLAGIHECVRAQFAEIERVAVALYDERTDTVKTFVNSTEGGSPLQQYEAFLAEVPSLGELARSGRERVVQDLAVFENSPRKHSRALLEKGYRSSYALPLRDGPRLTGFLFFDSTLAHYFTPRVVQQLRIFGELVEAAVARGLAPVRMLHTALRVASRLTHYRDPETSGHLDRMCRYARLIAQSLAGEDGLGDEFVEFVFLFAPAHDIGKIGIPDSILLKAGPLDADEFEVMKSHVTKGADMIDGILRELGLEAFPHARILRDIVLFHHEAVDGSGYPEGRAGEAIPIEARIVAAADVFDALTSERPYKKAWPTQEAFRYLAARSGGQFDERCVAVLRASKEKLEGIRTRFADEESGRFQSREGYTPDL